MQRAKAFTLLELLVVIGIIAILVGILLPAVSAARQASGKLTCTSNLRQWATAAHLYAEAYGNYLPRRGQGVGITTNLTRPTDWFNSLPVMLHMPAYLDLVTANQIPHVADGGLWICPQANDVISGTFFNYGMNMWLSTWNAPSPDQISEVGPTSTMVFMTDGPPLHCSVLPIGGLTGDEDYNPVPRHKGMVNISFLDGHVDSFPAAYVGCEVGFTQHPDLQWKPPFTVWAGPPGTGTGPTN